MPPGHMELSSVRRPWETAVWPTRGHVGVSSQPHLWDRSGALEGPRAHKGSQPGSQATQECQAADSAGMSDLLK